MISKDIIPAGTMHIQGQPCNTALTTSWKTEKSLENQKILVHSENTTVRYFSGVFLIFQNSYNYSWSYKEGFFLSSNSSQNLKIHRTLSARKPGGGSLNLQYWTMKK